MAQSGFDTSDEKFLIADAGPPYPLICDIHNLANFNESFSVCKKTNGDFPFLALTILDRNLTMLPSLIEETPNTTTVTMNDLNLTSINSEDISKWKHLTLLDVSYNNLKKLPNRFLSGCDTLFSLALIENEITEFEIDTFAALSSLTVLYLSSNRILTLDRDLFKPLINLKQLSLDNNRLQTVDPYLFRNNVKLDRLVLGHNNISIVDFRMVKKLQSLYISDNPIVSINLNGMDSLILLNISNCFLKSLFIPSNMRFMHASNNRISHITTQSNSKLLSLRIASNKLNDSFDLRSLVNLRVLDLSNNYITNLNFTNFYGLTKLLNLQITSIYIKDVNIIEMMKTMPALQRFNISSKHLSTEKAMQIKQVAKKNNFSVEIYHDEKTNTTALIKNGLVTFHEIGI